MKARRTPRQLCPDKHWCLCPSPSLGPRRPSFTGDSIDIVGGLPEVRLPSAMPTRPGARRLTLEVSMGDSSPARKKQRKATRAAIEKMRPMVAGIDIGSTEHWVCGPEGADGERQVRVFGATTPQLKE